MLNTVSDVRSIVANYRGIVLSLWSLQSSKKPDIKQISNKFLVLRINRGYCK